MVNCSVFVQPNLTEELLKVKSQPAESGAGMCDL